jgi:hypothetical protein
MCGAPRRHCFACPRIRHASVNPNASTAAAEIQRRAREAAEAAAQQAAEIARLAAEVQARLAEQSMKESASTSR